MVTMVRHTVDQEKPSLHHTTTGALLSGRGCGPGRGDSYAVTMIHSSLVCHNFGIDVKRW